jgi:hypothetical protein
MAPQRSERGAMTAIPEVLDALTRTWRTSADVQSAGIRPDQVLDGPPTSYMYSEGIAVGASREDNSVEFRRNPSSMTDSNERFDVTCLAWSGSGDTVFKLLRDRCDAFLAAADAALAADRTLGGVVSNAWLVDGAMTQEQTGQGALVMVEFTIEATNY